jgi:putative transposase
MLRLVCAIFAALVSSFRSRRDLVLENLALRQQLSTLASRQRPSIRPSDRVFWVTLRRLWSRWKDVLLIVQPETVVRWHRSGFRLYWARLARRNRPPGRPPLPPEVRNLVRRMAVENGWGATRIHGELLHLGIDVSERSVSRHLRSLPRRPTSGQSWATFLKNHRHGIAAMDFFTVPTATFRVLHVLFVISHGRRDVAWFGVTSSPTAAWVTQQLREAFPFENVPRFLLFDRGGSFNAHVVSMLRSMSVEPVRTGFRCPWQNGVAERFVATVRRELLDHVIVLNDRHLRLLLAEFVAYYQVDRTHLALDKDAPAGRPVEPRPRPTATVVGLRRVGGLHRRYAWRCAA